jgi:hypothetical protein
MLKGIQSKQLKKQVMTPSNATQPNPNYAREKKTYLKPNLTSRHLDVFRQALPHHLSLHQVSSRFRLLLLFGLDDVDDPVVGRAVRSVACRSIAPRGRALNLGCFWWLGRLHAADHGEWVLFRPADDHGPEALAGQMVVHVFYCVGHVQGVLASAFGAGVLWDVSILLILLKSFRF